MGSAVAVEKTVSVISSVVDKSRSMVAIIFDKSHYLLVALCTIISPKTYTCAHVYPSLLGDRNLAFENPKMGIFKIISDKKFSHNTFVVVRNTTRHTRLFFGWMVWC